MAGAGMLIKDLCGNRGLPYSAICYKRGSKFGGLQVAKAQCSCE